MRIKFSYKARPGLRIIDTISDGKIVWVRGYNGVGKSLAAKLLEILSGEHVFDNKSEYESLRKSLDHATITINLDDGTKLLAEVQPQKWNFEDATRMIEHESTGVFRINKEIVSAHQFGERFSARVIRGNESLPTQISTLITQALDQFRIYRSSSENLGDLSKNFKSMIQDELNLGSLQEYDRVDRRLSENAENIKRSDHEIEIIENNIGLLSRLMDVQENIQIREEYATTRLIESIKDSEEQLEILEAKNRKLQEERYEESIKLRQLAQVKDERYHATISNLRAVKAERDRLNDEIFPRLIELEFPSEAKLSKEIENRYQNLRKEAEAIDKEKQSERIIDEILLKQSHISSVLTNIEPDLDVTNEVIAHGKLPPIDTEIDISVNELQNMIEIQEGILLEKKKEATFKDYDKKLQWIANQQEKLDIIKKMLDQRRKINNRIKSLDNIMRSLIVSESEEYSECQRRITGIDEEIKANQFKISQKNNTLNSLRNISERINKIPLMTELISQRDAIAEQLEIETTIANSDYLRNRFEELRGLSTLKNKELNDLRSNTLYLQHKKLELEREFERNVRKLEIDERFLFLADWTEENKNEKPVVLLKKLSESLEIFVNAIGELAIKLKGIQDYHGELLRIVAQRPSEFSESEGVRRLEEIFNDKLREFYSREVFMKYVFEGFRKLESFDLRRNYINLMDVKGNPQSKPISSFSTGQKAFAFSIAMISLVFSKPSYNRVLFLDEFGALLDYMREDVLMEQVQKRVLAQNIVQKIVILLPVRERLENIIDNLEMQKKATSSAKERMRFEEEIRKYRNRSNELSQKGYYEEVQNAS